MGGSESRFTVQPDSVEDDLVMRLSPKDYREVDWVESAEKVSSSHPFSSLEKVVIKYQGQERWHVRFDVHPQPFWGVRDGVFVVGDGKDGENVSWDWHVIAHGTLEPGESVWDDKKSCILNEKTALDTKFLFTFLCPDQKCVLTFEHGQLGTAPRHQFDVSMFAPKFRWILTCVDHNLSAGEVTAAVVSPVAAMGIVGGGVFAGGLALGVSAEAALAGVSMTEAAIGGTIVAGTIAGSSYAIAQQVKKQNQETPQPADRPNGSYTFL